MSKRRTRPERAEDARHRDGPSCAALDGEGLHLRIRGVNEAFLTRRLSQAGSKDERLVRTLEDDDERKEGEGESKRRTATKTKTCVPPSSAAESRKLYLRNQVERYLRRYHWDQKASTTQKKFCELMPALRYPNA